MLILSFLSSLIQFLSRKAVSITNTLVVITVLDVMFLCSALKVEFSCRVQITTKAVATFVSTQIHLERHGSIYSPQYLIAGQNGNQSRIRTTLNLKLVDYGTNKSTP